MYNLLLTRWLYLLLLPAIANAAASNSRVEAKKSGAVELRVATATNFYLTLIKLKQLYEKQSAQKNCFKRAKA